MQWIAMVNAMLNNLLEYKSVHNQIPNWKNWNS